MKVFTISSETASANLVQSVEKLHPRNCDDVNKQAPVPSRRSSRGRDQRRPKWRPVSMGSTVEPLYEADPIEQDAPRPCWPGDADLTPLAKRDKARKKEPFRPQGFVTSSSMTNLEPHVYNLGGSCDNCKQSQWDAQHHEISPFQKAVEDSGIIPNKALMSRRMSREEVLAATILSQMKREKKLRKTRGGEKSLKSKSVPSNLSGWEAEGGKMLSSPVVTKKDRKHRTKSTEHALATSSSCEAYSINSFTRKKKPSVEKVVIDRSSSVLYAQAKGWRTTEMDDLPHNPVHFNDIRFPNPVNPESIQQGQSSNYYSTKRGSGYNTGRDIPDDIIEREIQPNMVVIRYDVTTPMPQKWIDITRYSPEHTPQQTRSSPGLSSSLKADINELLSVGINANPDIIRRYDYRLNRDYTPTANRNEMYRPSQYSRERRRSSNIAVQTTESRL